MSSYVTKNTPGDTSWFTAARFGMFVHWGLYSIPARNSEWVKKIEEIPEDKYQEYFDHFNPDMYDPTKWAKAAKAAGMKYVVFTTKHHEGFCMFDTKYTDYKVTNTKYGKDILKEFVDAFRAEGIHIGLYYSLVDWHHPEFPIDITHPRNCDPDAYEMSKDRDMTIYAKYMRDQLEELMTNYGKIDIVWTDYSYPNPEVIEGHEWWKGKGRNEWESEKLIATVRKYNPDVIMNGRADIEQDIFTPEQYQVRDWPTDDDGNLYVWEACHTLCNSWGYDRSENRWKSPEMLIKILIDTVALGGNLIMNVGPTARGFLTDDVYRALGVYEEWMKYNDKSIYNCTKAEPCFKAPQGTRLTQSVDGKKLYIHLMEYPYKFLEMENLADKIEFAQFLHDGSEIQYTEGMPNVLAHNNLKPIEGLVAFDIPLVKPNTVIPVIEVTLK